MFFLFYRRFLFFFLMAALFSIFFSLRRSICFHAQTEPHLRKVIHSHKKIIEITSFQKNHFVDIPRRRQRQFDIVVQDRVH